jgi:hypothetical protein
MNTIAKTILQQLGGDRFIRMTGAKHFTADDQSLTFKLASSRIGKYIKITLNGTDLYDIDFITGKGYKVNTIKDVFAENLTAILEQSTGLYFSL